MNRKTDKPGTDPAPTPPPAHTEAGGNPPPSSSEGTGEGSQTRPPVSRRGSKPGVRRGPYNRKGGRFAKKPGETGDKVDRFKKRSLASTLKALSELVALIPLLKPMELDEEDAKALADALHQWNEAYPDIQVSDKASANIMLITTLGVVFGPRLYLVKLELDARAEAARQAARPKAPVVKLRQVEPIHESDPAPGDIEPPATP